MTNPIVIDASHWQGAIDFEALKAGGTLGVILKSSQGTSYVDPTYESNKDAAQAAGLYVSAYHFLEHGDIANQMDHFFRTANLPTRHRLCIDYEHEDCIPDDLLDAVQWLVAELPQYEIAVYGSSSRLNVDFPQYNGLLAANTSLWVARYGASAPTWPQAIWPTWSLWQYSQEEAATGIEGPVDANRWNGSDENLAAWFVVPDKKPKPPVEPRVGVELVIPAGVRLTITVNGDVVYE